MVSAKAVTLASHRGLYVGPADADLLRPSIGATDQAAIAFQLLIVQGLFQRIEHEVLAYRIATSMRLLVTCRASTPRSSGALSDPAIQ